MLQKNTLLHDYSKETFKNPNKMCKKHQIKSSSFKQCPCKINLLPIRGPYLKQPVLQTSRDLAGNYLHPPFQLFQMFVSKSVSLNCFYLNFSELPTIVVYHYRYLLYYNPTYLFHEYDII